jgi:glycosyltransferase involved in cell wall biosynthesis
VPYNPLVSIAIDNYNYGRFLGSAIDSALNQTYHNIEVVVVDDGSTDNSRDIIDSYKDRIVKVFKKNGGQASAFNAAFKASKGDIICFLDSDDIFTPEKVAEVVKVFGKYDDIGWCFHRLKLLDENTGELIKFSREVSSGKYDARYYMRIGAFPSFLARPATSATSFKRSLLQQILPMNESIKITSDKYLKFTAIALSKGFILNKPLSIQKIHDLNLYSLQNNKQLENKINFITACVIREKFPQLARFTNNIFAQALASCSSNKDDNVEYKELIKSYLVNLSGIERIEIKLKYFFYRTKNIINHQ